jgi:hypothetical protein
MTADKTGPRLDDEMKKETEEVERAGKESRVEDEREQQQAEGHRIAGSGASTDDHPHRDRGEEGAESHPKPKER